MTCLYLTLTAYRNETKDVASTHDHGVVMTKTIANLDIQYVRAEMLRTHEIPTEIFHFPFKYVMSPNRTRSKEPDRTGNSGSVEYLSRMGGP